MGKDNKPRVPIWAEHTESPLPVKHRGLFLKVAVIVLAAAGLAAGGIAIWSPLLSRLFLVGIGTFRKRSPPLFLSLFLVGIVVILLLWKLPKVQVTRSQALTDENRFERENEARKTLAQILGGIFVLAGLYSSVQTLNLSREGQITDRFTKAIEQLGALDGSGNPKLEVRLGGIYALQRIARDSERDDWVIMEVLTAYIRENSSLARKTGQKTPKEPDKLEPKKVATPIVQEIPQHPDADIQAVLTVLSQRQVEYDRRILDLSMTNLRGADLTKAQLHFANLTGTDLSGAHLRYTNLRNAHLSGANFSGADLGNGMHYCGYSSSWEDCGENSGGNILGGGADLEGANLSGANLSGANLSGANLTGADLSMAYLSNADLRGGAPQRGGPQPGGPPWGEGSHSRADRRGPR
jgi:hypothetical protein